MADRRGPPREERKEKSPGGSARAGNGHNSTRNGRLPQHSRIRKSAGHGDAQLKERVAEFCSARPRRIHHCGRSASFSATATLRYFRFVHIAASEPTISPCNSWCPCTQNKKLRTRRRAADLSLTHADSRGPTLVHNNQERSLTVAMEAQHGSRQRVPTTPYAHDSVAGGRTTRPWPCSR